MPYFSVIVPIYEVEAYLPTCVDSILGQTFSDFECILVDDGSPDGCPAICDAYAEQDNRVRVIHKENGGLSDARNAGMRIATGEYLLFVDGDDWWCSDRCLETMYQEICSGEGLPDIAVYLFLFQKGWEENLRPTSVRYQIPELNMMSRPDAMRTCLKKGFLLSSASEGCYRTAFLRENGLYFTEGIRSEDTEWIIRIYAYRPRIWYTNHLFYVYRSRPGSITSTPDLQKCKEYADFLIKHTNQMDLTWELDCLRLCYIAYHYLVCLANLCNLSEQGASDLLEQMYEYRFLLNYDLVPKVRLAHRVERVLGIRTMVRLLALYLRKRGSQES